MKRELKGCIFPSFLGNNAYVSWTMVFRRRLAMGSAAFRVNTGSRKQCKERQAEKESGQTTNKDLGCG